MHKLSSDSLFYRYLFSVVFLTAALYLFITKLLVNDFLPVTVNILLAVLAALFVFLFVRAFRYKQILYDKTHLQINTYFFRKQIQIPVSDIISIDKISSLYQRELRVRYRLFFYYNNQVRQVDFFKSLKLFAAEDLEKLLGVENKSQE